MAKTLLLSEIFPPQTGGSGRWFWEIYRRMPRKQVTVIAGEDDGQWEFDCKHNLNLVRAPLAMPDWGIARPTAFFHYWKLFLTVRRVVREQGIEQIHCGRCLPEGWIALMFKKLCGIPYACYVHGEDANATVTGEADGVMSSRQLRWMTAKVLNSCEYVIANSRNSCRIVREQWDLPEERIRLLHPGVDTDYFVPAARDVAAREALGWGDRPVFLTVGRLQKRKGHDTMIRALSTIREAIPDVLFAVIGDGEEREALAALAESEQQQQHVLFMGKVDDDVLKAAYQQADLFVLANRQIGTDIEGFGMVLLEAQACGTPVVAGTSGGTAETMDLGRTGYVVPCDESDEPAALIAELLLDPYRLKQMGAAARNWTVDNFDWEALSRHAAKLFAGEPAAMDHTGTTDDGSATAEATEPHEVAVNA